MFFVFVFETFTANSTKSCLVRRPKYAKLKIIFFYNYPLTYAVILIHLAEHRQRCQNNLKNSDWHVTQLIVKSKI